MIQCFMTKKQANNPLHGITLETAVTSLVDYYGWDGLAKHIDINCFKSNPSIKSSLKFLRNTPWAREKVENLYLLKVRNQLKLDLITLLWIVDALITSI